MMQQIAAFDIYDLNDFYDTLLNIYPSGAMTPTFDQLGFESMYFLNNMGLLSLWFLLYAIAVILTVLWTHFCCTTRKYSRRFANWG
jgi:hypothetical protein